MPPDAPVSDAPSESGVTVENGVGKVPITTPLAPETPGPDIASIVPEAYRDKPWVQEIKSADQLFKRLDDQIQTLSKRPAGIPQENASEEEWQAFNKAAGVPEDAKEYSFEIEGKEYTERDAAFHDALRPALQKAGLTQRQLAILAPEFDKVITGLATDAGQQAGLKDQDFDSQMTDTFGDRRGEVIETGKKLLTTYAPEALKDHLQNLDNKSLVVLAGVLDKINSEFIQEGSIPAGSNTGLASMSESDRQAKRLALMASEPYRNEFHPQHRETRRQVEELYGTYLGDK